MTYLAGLAQTAQGTQRPAGPGQPARPSPAAGRRKHVIRTLLIAWLVRWPLDRRFWHAVVLLGIALGAARASARDNQARVVAWDTRQRQRQMKALAARASRAARRA